MAGGMGYGTAPEGPVKPPTFLAGSVLVTICCCLPFGITAIVYGILVQTRWSAQDFEGSRHASEMAEKWMYASIGLGVIVFVLSRIYAFFTGVGRFTSGRF